MASRATAEQPAGTLTYDWAGKQRSPAKHAFGLTAVIGFHAILAFLLMTGLGHKAIQVVKKATTVVVELPPPPPPPPPPPKPPEPPKPMEKAPPPPPPPVFVPPPETPVVAPPTAVVVESVPTPPPPVEYKIEPPPPPAPPVVAPPAPPAPPIRRGNFNILNKGDVEFTVPREATKAGVTYGKVVAQFDVSAEGVVGDVRIVSANPPRIFNREVINKIKQWRFAPEPVGFVGEVEVEFKVD